jgi:hypothetical protein
MELPISPAKALSLSIRSLEGLSLGDAFGEMYMSIYPNMGPELDLPSSPWSWTDDTHMALSIIKNLKTHGRIKQNALAQTFARRYKDEPYRGYARGAIRRWRQAGGVCLVIGVIGGSTILQQVLHPHLTVYS